MTMPVYPGPTAAVMAACLPQTRTLSTRLPGQHHTEPATALQGGRTHLTPPPEPQRCPRGIGMQLPACLYGDSHRIPYFGKGCTTACHQPFSNRDATRSPPFPIRVHSWITGRADNVGQEAGHEPASMGPRSRRLVHCGERGGLGTDAKLMLPVWQPALSKMEMGKEQGLVAKGCGCCRPLIPKSSRRNSIKAE